MMNMPDGTVFRRLRGVLPGIAGSGALLLGAASAFAQTATTAAPSLLPLKAPLIFNSDFEDGKVSLDNWIISGNAPVASTSPTPRRGKYAMKSHLDRVSSSRSYRTEVAMRVLRARPNEDYWYGFSIFLPNDYVADPIWEILAQWHGVPDTHLGESDENLNPPLALHSENGEWVLSTIWDAQPVSHRDHYDGKRKYKLGSHVRGTWTDWVFHIRWSHTSSGLLQVWKDGKQVVNTAGPIGFNDVKGPYLKLGIYKGWRDRVNPVGVVKTRTVYHDEIRVAHGPSAKYTDVAPGGRRPQPPDLKVQP